MLLVFDKFFKVGMAVDRLRGRWESPETDRVLEEVGGSLIDGAARAWNEAFGAEFRCVAAYPAVETGKYGRRRQVVCGVFTTGLPPEKIRRLFDEELLREVDVAGVVGGPYRNPDPELAEKDLRDYTVRIGYRDSRGEWVKELHLPGEEEDGWGSVYPEMRRVLPEPGLPFGFELEEDEE